MAVVGVIALSSPVSADSTTGLTGHFLFTDSSGTPGAKCTYVIEQPSNLAFIHKFTVKPPKGWWPDTNSSINNQHGKVGWRFILEETTNGTDWVTVKHSSVQKATAYEDSQNPYGSATKASFSKMALTINAHNYPYGEFRVTVTAYWYKANGSQLGSASHTVEWYRSVAGTDKQTFDGGCLQSG